jgi:hypothetical protein
LFDSIHQEEAEWEHSVHRKEGMTEEQKDGLEDTTFGDFGDILERERELVGLEQAGDFGGESSEHCAMQLMEMSEG